MNAEVFVDTNVFLYSISDQPEEHPKAERARELLLTENWGWSVPGCRRILLHRHIS